MKATIHAPEPLILQDATPGRLFLIHAPGMQECVFALLDEGGAPWNAPAPQDWPIVVIASRVGRSDPGYSHTGALLHVDRTTPITFVEQVEPVAFRAALALHIKADASTLLDDLGELFDAARKIREDAPRDPSA